jgi:integrase/recombinase XerD
MLEWKKTTKHNMCEIYSSYLKYLGKTWTQPKYTKEQPVPFIPTETEIDSLIASAWTPKTATLLQLLKETGARIGEIDKLKWTHIDQERRTVYITAEKGSYSRLLPISTKLQAMLNNLPKINEKVFQASKHGHTTTFLHLRSQAAKKLNNPRLKQIHLHTFRHFKGTMEYHKTKDIVHVKQVLGHKSIDNTMIYINIEQAIFLEQNDEWTSKAAKTPTECMKLIDAGFTLADTIEGIHIYRKRK